MKCPDLNRNVMSENSYPSWGWGKFTKRMLLKPDGKVKIYTEMSCLQPIHPYGGHSGEGVQFR